MKKVIFTITASNYYLTLVLLYSVTINTFAQSNLPGAGNAFEQAPLQNYRVTLGNTKLAIRPTTAITACGFIHF